MTSPSSKQIVLPGPGKDKTIIKLATATAASTLPGRWAAAAMMARVRSAMIARGQASPRSTDRSGQNGPSLGLYCTTRASERRAASPRQTKGGDALDRPLLFSADCGPRAGEEASTTTTTGHRASARPPSAAAPNRRHVKRACFALLARCARPPSTRRGNGCLGTAPPPAVTQSR